MVDGEGGIEEHRVIVETGGSQLPSGELTARFLAQGNSKPLPDFPEIHEPKLGFP